MAIKLFTNATMLDATMDMISTIDNSDFSVDHIIVVPDKFSLQMERLVLNNLNKSAFFNLRVEGITELAEEILSDEKDEIISSGESLLLTQKAIENIRDKLFVFRKNNISFCYEINKIIMQLKSSLVGPDDLNEGARGLAGEKFHDLKLIYGEYERLRVKSDANARLSLAGEKVEKSDIFKNTKIYFAQFDAFTKEGYKLLKSLIISAKEVSFSLAQAISVGNEYLYEKDAYQKLVSIAKKRKNNAKNRKNNSKKDLQE